MKRLVPILTVFLSVASAAASNCLPTTHSACSSGTKHQSRGHTVVSCHTPRTHALKPNPAVCAPGGTRIVTLSIAHVPDRSSPGQ